MSKKIIFLLVVLFLFSRSHLVFGSPVINELMYDLDGADIDWVEIYNPNSEDVDLTSLKLLVSNSTSNHGIVKHSGSEILHQGEYGIIVPSSDIEAFTNKWGNSGNIFTASFSLPNETEKVEINNGDKTSSLSSVTYNSTQGASGDGNSLQLINGTWKAALPTLGSTNNISVSTISSTSTTSSNSSVSNSSNNESSYVQNTSTITKTKISEEPKIKTKILSKNLVFAGVPVEFQVKTTGYSGETLSSGKYFWNFGDGDSREASGTDRFTHVYAYSGEYVVSLEYYMNVYISEPIAVDKITIKVVPIQVSISKVGNEKDFFIELSNSSEYEIDISKWILSSGEKKFIFPKNSIIMPKRSIILSDKITQFVSSDARNLKLVLSTGEVAYDYGVSLAPIEVVVKNEISVQAPAPVLEKTTINIKTIEPVQSISQSNTSEDKNIKIEKNVSVPAVQKASKNLSASAVESGVLPGSSKNLYLSFIGLVVFLGFSAGSVYFIRRNRVALEDGEDFEIIDE
ncbi:MAG: lamin tail domain-containing protein [Minisyncoccia bacterium]